MKRMALAFVILAGFADAATRKAKPTYRDGFLDGYSAYITQCGKYIPIPPIPNKTGYQEGYEDGYHMTIRCENCPVKH